MGTARHAGRWGRSQSARVRNIRSPATTGDELPWPASEAFHRTPSVAVHRRGADDTSAMPFPEAPRHRGQSCAQTPSGDSETNQPMTTVVRVIDEMSYPSVAE